MPCHSEIGQSKFLFLLTVALLCFQAKKLPFSHGNGHSDWLTEWFVPVQVPNDIPSGKHKRFTFLYQVALIILCSATNYPVSQVLDTQFKKVIHNSTIVRVHSLNSGKVAATPPPPPPRRKIRPIAIFAFYSLNYSLAARLQDNSRPKSPTKVETEVKKIKSPSTEL